MLMPSELAQHLFASSDMGSVANERLGIEVCTVVLSKLTVHQIH